MQTNWRRNQDRDLVDFQDCLWEVLWSDGTKVCIRCGQEVRVELATTLEGVSR